MGNDKMINMGLDFATKNNRITGSVEYFQKEGNNLLEKHRWIIRPE